MKEDALLLLRLEKRDGYVRPEAVVNEARDAAHPWHSRFEWNDSVAAESFRLDQARTLIRTIKVERNVADMIIRCPQFVRAPDLPAHVQGYRSIAKVKSSRQQARMTMIDELSRLTFTLRRTQEIAVALGMGKPILQILTSVDKLLRRLEQSDEDADAA